MFKNVKLGTKLGFGFGVILLLLIAVAAAGYWGANSVSSTAINEFREMLRTDAAIAEHGARARANVLGLRRFEKDLFLNIGSKEKQEEYLKNWKEQNNHLLARLNDLEKAATLQQDKDTVKTMRTELAAYEEGFGKIYEMIKEEKIKSPQEANKAINDYKDTIHKLEQAAAAFSTEGNKKMADTENDIKAAAKQTSLITTIGALFSVILGIIISIFLTRSITKPITRVAEGLSDGAEQVASASAQVSASSQALAEGGSEQAASIEETSASIEEMASMTKQNAQSANQANVLMTETAAVIEEAKGSMGELIGSMREISAASEETAKIIKTIDEIAFQTNLLALNAAVEAARAGEAGAGFAVVADEVRNLAMRAAEAAKNTANLIEGTVKKINNGSDIVAKTNESFSKVATSSKKVGELVGEISAASNEQAEGVDQINKAVAEMDKVVQQNASSAEESASAAEEMNAQAEQMKVYVGDLMMVVGGSANGNGSLGNGGGLLYARASAHKAPALPENMVGRRLAISSKAHKKVVDPEQLIPMKEGTFKDF